MEIRWYCWATAISLITNFHGCLCWPTLQPPLRPVTSKHELDTEESRKVLGSSVVTSVSVIMDHGNGTKTFLTDGIDNPELKSNIIGSPANLMSPDKYEFYTFDETGDLVKRLMTWDEIQGLIAGSDGDGVLGDASVPVYYSDTVSDKFPQGATHITANDFQTSDIQGVHKVVESVQNVLKSELAASQGRLPPVVKPAAFLANSPNWSVFLPTLMDNAEGGSELSNAHGSPPPNRYPSAATNADSTPSSTIVSSTLDLATIESRTSTTESPSHSSAVTASATTASRPTVPEPVTGSVSSTTTVAPPTKDFVAKKTEKPFRYKSTTAKSPTPNKNTYGISAKTSARPVFESSSAAAPARTSSASISTTHAFSSSKKPFSTSKYASNDFWYSTTAATSTKKIFTSPKYGGYVNNDGDETTPLTRKNPTTQSSTDGVYSSTNEQGWSAATSAESSPATDRISSSSAKAPAATDELHASIADVLHQVSDNTKTSGSFTQPSTTSSATAADRFVTTAASPVPTESTRYPGFNRTAISNQFKIHHPTEGYKNANVTSGHHQASTTADANKATSISSATTSKSTTDQHTTKYTSEKYSTTGVNKYYSLGEIDRHDGPESVASTIYTYKPSTVFNKFPTSDSRRPGITSSFKYPSTLTTHSANQYGLHSHKIVPSYSYKPATEFSKNPFVRTTTVSGNEELQTIATSSTKSENTPLSSSKYDVAESKTNTKATSNGTPSPPSTPTSSPVNIFKSTKTYESSTSTGFTAHFQKQPLTVKSPKPTKTYFTKATTPKPIEYSQSVSFTRPHHTVSSPSSTQTEKPLVRISTVRSTASSGTVPTSSVQTTESASTSTTTVKPEPLITWISTFPVDETPSKTPLHGVFDTEKLVTEQYVSSAHDNRPVNVQDIFKHSTQAVAAANISTPAATTLAITTEEPTYVPLSTETTPITKTWSYTTTARPFRTSERPLPPILESKTEQPSRHSSSSSPVVHTMPYNVLQSKTTVKPQHTSFSPSSTSSAAVAQNLSSETVMQRIPTINPPNKLSSHVPSSSVAVTKTSVRPSYASTEALKNITQIAVMLNRLNETIKNGLKNEYRNKVTNRPMFDSTKPIGTLVFNDCITSLIANSITSTTRENYTGNDGLVSTVPPPTTMPPPAHKQSSNGVEDVSENSHIYYYKLPPITLPQQDSHTSPHYSSRPSSTLVETTYYRPETTESVAQTTTLAPITTTTEKEYQKITTVNRPSTVVQEGISAVTNILLQTEGRVPNKEVGEFETSNATSALPSEPVESRTTAGIASNQTASSTTSVAAAATTVSATTKRVEATTLPTQSRTTTFSSSSITTTELLPATTEDDLTTTWTMPTTTLGVDSREDYVLDDHNITQEEEEDLRNYHPYVYNSTNRNLTESATIRNKNTTPAAPKLSSGTTKSTAASTTTSTTALPTTSAAAPKPEPSRRPTTTTTPAPATAVTASSAVANATAVKYVPVVLENRTSSTSTQLPSSAYRTPSSPSMSKSPQSSTVNPAVELHPAPHESMGLEASVAYLGDDVKRFIDFCNELSFKIWTTQTGKSLVTSRSIVLSPFSVLSTLAMIFLGARGSSSGIMNDFLRLDDMVTFNPHQVLQNITESVVNVKNSGVANAAFVREIFSDKSKGKVLDFYKERLQQYYDTHIEEITFNIIGDLVRRRTNLLVKRQTQGRIQDYLRGSALVLKPPLAALTANIFQTDCSVASTEGRDGEMYFVVRPSTRQRRLVPIPAVVYRSGFLAGYEPGLDATAVTLNPESTVSTILVLPGQQGQVAPGDGLARLEQRLLESSYRRGAWSRLLRSLLFRPGLELQIPRFSHKSVLNLTAGLQKMGMGEIFAYDKADLRGINGVSNDLHLSDIVQVNTFSTCGEEAVGARHHIETYPSSPQRVGRATDVFDRSYLEDTVNNYYSSLPLNLRPRQARLPDNPRLRFDRPFLYIVRHNPTGLILYIGRFNPRLLP